MPRSALARAIHTALLGGGVLWAPGGGAQPFTEMPPISTGAAMAQEVHAVDLDSDGDVDVLSASIGDEKIAWFENDGAQNFAIHTITTDAQDARSVFAADLDADGDVDVVSASSTDHKIAWYENDGDQNFTPHTITTGALGASSVFVADADGDGNLDVASASRLDNTIAWYRNDGAVDPSFTPEVFVSSGADFAQSVFAADIDGDGDTDFLSASQTDNEISWYEFNGLLVPYTKHTISTTADQTWAVAAADLDGDGDIDVLSANAGADALIAWYENDGSQNFSEQLVGAGAPFATSVTTADVDGDGDVDVLSASFADNKIAWYENDGLPDPSFTTHTISTAASGTYSVFVADVDGDGDMDALSASFFDDKIAWYRNERITDAAPFSTQLTISTENSNAEKVFSADLDGDGDPDLISGGSILAWHENDGNENFALQTVAGSTAVQSVYADDIDRDGDLDLLVASIGGTPDKIAWHDNDGMADPGFTVRTIADTTNGARWARSADLDGDGDIDVASASYTDDKIAWFENNGAQTFTEHTIVSDNGDGDLDLVGGAYFDGVAWYENDGMADPTFAINTVVAGKRVTSVAFGDIDGDGDIDLASASQLDDTIAWYENDGMTDPTFTLHTISTLADGARGVVVGDLDRDGDVDLASVSRNDNTVAWYENDGSESFTTHTLTTAAADARGIAVADLDRDGDADLLSASLGDDKIAWYENLLPHREAAFLGRDVIASNANGARAVAAADVDSDGDTDVLSASVSDSKVAWYRNDGDGAFSAFPIDTTAFGAWDVVTADINRDGRLDVVAPASSLDELRYYLNDGNQNFAPNSVPTADSPRSAVAADIDRDGDVDFAAAALIDDQVSWFENDGALNFTENVLPTISLFPRDVSLGDVDRDGNLDLLSAFSIGALIRWYDNDGSGNFATRTVTAQAAGAFSAEAVDVDRDGDIDVVAAAFIDDKIAWYENSGSESFTEHTISASADGARMAVAADLDGDGDIDVVSASNTDNEIAWFENDGAQNFSTEILTGSADGAYSVATADVDGDGDTDVLSASSGDDTIGLFDNCGGNFSVAASNAAPGTLGDGRQAALLRLRVRHEGRSGDETLELVSMGFRFEDDLARVHTTPQFNALVASLDIYRDDGSNAFDPNFDVLVDTLPGDVNLRDGVRVLHFADGDGEAQIAAGALKTYFLTATLTPDASQQAQNRLRAVYLGGGADRAKGKGTSLGTAFAPSCAVDVASGPLTAIPPGITVDPVAGLTSTEAPGMSEFFNVVLDTEPAFDVTIAVSSSDLSEGTVDQSMLTFTPGNWNLPQTVFVTGVDDPLVDGDVDYSVILDPAVSADLGYNGIDPPDVSVTNLDDEPRPEEIFADGFEGPVP